MKNINSRMQQYSKRAVTTFGLALLLSSGQAMAAKTQPIAPSDGNPFVLTYNCVENDYQLPLVSDPIPEGYYLAVEHIYGRLGVQGNASAPESIWIHSYSEGVASHIQLLTENYMQNLTLLNHATSISFTNTPPDVWADDYTGIFSQSTFCNVNIHGKLFSY